MKRGAALLAMLLVCSLLGGCGGKNTASVEEVQMSSASPAAVETTTKPISLVKKQNKARYLITNGIEFSRKKVALQLNNDTIEKDVPQIAGLADQEVEQRVNQAIVQDIQASIGWLGCTDEVESFYSDVHVNTNNILSVFVYSFSTQFGFNYSLTDGKRLQLKELFTEGTDYVRLLNQKVTECILAGVYTGYEGRAMDEEDLLRSPFTTIKPDQEFFLRDQEVVLVFQAGEAGFAENSTVPISLAQIEDYVDIYDRYAEDMEKTQLKAEKMEKKNNIFISNTTKSIETKAGIITIRSCTVSGLQNEAFQKQINDWIDGAVEKALNKPLPKGKRIYAGDDLLKDIWVSHLFNSYGILHLDVISNLYGYEGHENNDSVSVCFDLNKMRQTSERDILKKYMEDYPKQKAVFAKLVVEQLKENDPDHGFAKRLDELINYEFIMDERNRFEFGWRGDDGIEVRMDLYERPILSDEKSRYCSILLKDFILSTPEEFFGS